jgi:hypothetical protein
MNWRGKSRTAFVTLVHEFASNRELEAGRITWMSNPGSMFRPYSKLIQVQVLDRIFDVPENNPLLRALQFVAAERIAYGRFCWNEECQYCRVNYDLGEGTPERTALGCKLIVQEGMRIKDVSLELKYCLRELGLKIPESDARR